MSLFLFLFLFFSFPSSLTALITGSSEREGIHLIALEDYLFLLALGVEEEGNFVKKKKSFPFKMPDPKPVHPHRRIIVQNHLLVLPKKIRRCPFKVRF